MTEKKALVLDIDGTLTNSKKEITQNTKNAIWGAVERGHKVILASGRPTPGMRQCEQELRLAEKGGYLLSFNGARIVDCESGEIVYQRTLPGSAVSKLYHFAREHGAGIVTYLGDTVISAFEPDEYIMYEANINKMPVRVEKDFVYFVDFEVNKCLMTAPPEKAAELEKLLQEKYGDMLSIYRSEPFFVEIMPQKVDKATALGKILPVLGVTRENTICCGDGFNDIPMIRYAGVGVAMGNAQEAVKKEADYITDTNDNDGLVEVIQRFM